MSRGRILIARSMDRSGWIERLWFCAGRGEHRLTVSADEGWGQCALSLDEARRLYDRAEGSRLWTVLVSREEAGL